MYVKRHEQFEIGYGAILNKIYYIDFFMTKPNASVFGKGYPDLQPHQYTYICLF